MSEAPEAGPIIVDGSPSPHQIRRILVWRRLEPGDIRSEGSELAPESALLETRVLEVGIAQSRFEELSRVAEARDRVRSPTDHISTRYEGPGTLFATGGGLSLGVFLGYLPASWLAFSLSLSVLGVVLGAITQMRRRRAEAQARDAWKALPEAEEEQRLAEAIDSSWERFTDDLLEDSGFRVDVNVGDTDAASRLVSLDTTRLADPQSWAAGEAEQVRYGAIYSDGRFAERVAEILDDENPTPESPPSDDEDTGADDTP